MHCHRRAARSATQGLTVAPRIAVPEAVALSTETFLCRKVFSHSQRVLPPQLTLRSWIHSEENKRRTLQRSDIATAIARTEVYDFLIVRSTRSSAAPVCKRKP